VITCETDPGLHSAFTMAPIVYAIALIFAEPILGLARLQGGVDEIFARMPEPT